MEMKLRFSSDDIESKIKQVERNMVSFFNHDSGLPESKYLTQYGDFLKELSEHYYKMKIGLIPNIFDKQKHKDKENLISIFKIDTLLLDINTNYNKINSYAAAMKTLSNYKNILYMLLELDKKVCVLYEEIKKLELQLKGSVNE